MTSSARIHPSAVVEDGARLGEGVVVGPFCHIGMEVELGDRARLVSHVVLSGRTRIGADAEIHPFASLGAPAQDLKSREQTGALVIGCRCLVREGVTINAGTLADGGETRIGDDCAFLAYSHVGHDCRIGDGVVLSNNVLLGGHVRIGDHAAIGGATVAHQRVRIGAQAFVAGLSGLEGDLVPFGLAGGNRAHLFGLNLVGLRRRGFADTRLAVLREAFRRLFPPQAGSQVLAQRIEAVARDFAGVEDVEAVLDFLRAERARPLCAPRPGRG
ncbi:acyl-ACP--UDP-N-acetylglucosamine O-acyltransferase [Methylosinus sp. Ce-a6]|uniref:acyl-ACP--UDP-N-acetylglucosamine O-acyltransferase n=1 Tax=Methylosinus sp. Ce-a6 TaxID=2172005 RepID=UPI0013585DB6|nr:acyl-ACP--UDP-N-acetylglucosamine O-acyltransferase [Methylosinus sp. Ce-a6]